MPHGVPTTVELVEALRTFLEEDVMPGTEGRLSFMARVAGNVSAMLERELVLGPAMEVEHRELLDRLGRQSDRDLAEAVRAGQLDDRLDEVVALVRGDVVNKLSLWNPRYVEPDDADRIVRMPGDESFPVNQTRTGEK